MRYKKIRINTRSLLVATVGQDTLNTRRTLNVGEKEYDYYSLSEVEKKLGDISRLPYSMKVLLENLLRYEDGVTVSTDDIKAIIDWQKEKRMNREIQYRPARVLMQDFTGVPAVVDLAAMRNAVQELGGNPTLTVKRLPFLILVLALTVTQRWSMGLQFLVGVSAV
jgi:aconitate hydratase